METKSIKLFAMAMVCVLSMATVLSASDAARALKGDDKGDENPDESNKRVVSPSFTTTPPIHNHAINQGHTSPPESPISYSAISKSPSLVDNSKKLSPPPEPEDLNSGAARKVGDKAPRSPPNKEDSKNFEASKEEGDKPLQSLEKGDHKAIQVPAFINKAPEDPKADHVQEQNEAKSNTLNPDVNNSRNESCESANALNLTCRTGILFACILQSSTESTEFLIIQNTGEDDLNVNITSLGKVIIDPKLLKLPKHSNKKIKLMADASMGLKIILNAGNGDCVLQTRTPSSNWLYLQQFPAYAAQVRPMHGAYFLFATLIIVGGTWAFCRFGKKGKRVDAGIPYQQLEMATAHTRSASVPDHAVSADAWDQGWDDDWDDEEADIRTSAKNPAENISSNGRTSRAANSNQNGWEIDWDD